MATPELPFLPSTPTNDALIDFCRRSSEASFTKFNMRQKFEYIDREFYRKNMLNTEHQKIRIQQRAGNKIVVADVCMPILETQIETSVAFLTSVFLTGQPIFGIVSPPDLIKQAKQLEAVSAENQVHGGWAAEIIMSLRDGLKYNFMAMEIDWKRETIYQPMITVVPGKQNKDDSKDLLWEGNCLKRCDPYNTLFDARVPLHLQHKFGEFVGYTDLMTRIMLKQFIEDLPYKINVKKAFQSGFGASTGKTGLYYKPAINELSNFDVSRASGTMNWMQWASLDKKSAEFEYKEMYVVTTRYIRIIPREFGMPVPRNGQTQIWKIITVNDQVIIYIERMTNAHNYFPIIIGQMYNDGLGLQSEGLGEKLIPIQDLGSASWNARLASQRRKVSDRGIYDPSRIRPEDINSDNPSAKIPVKANVYGKDVKEAYYAIPFEDSQSGSYIADAKEFKSFGNEISGQNPAQQGQFVKGNKTQAEYEDVQNKSSGRQRTQAIFVENQFFTPVKHIMKLNILQYQPNGPITNPTDGKKYEISREELRTAALMFKVSDGLLPTDKLVSSPTLQVALQAIATSPELQSEYKLGKLFSYLMAVEGADLTPFELTMAEKQQIMQNRIAAQATAAGTKNAAIEATTRPEVPAGG